MGKVAPVVTVLVGLIVTALVGLSATALSLMRGGA